MTEFAQALARIEDLSRSKFTRDEVVYIDALLKLMEHVDSIVQLAKVAETLRTAEYAREISAANAAYDKLMKGSER